MMGDLKISQTLVREVLQLDNVVCLLSKIAISKNI